jgi:hypothetical protein
MSSQRLVPFDASVAPSIDLSVTVDRRGSDLQISYRMMGAVETIAFPSESLGAVAAERRMGLWEMTCFEFFLGVPGREDYWEVNLSPAGHWNVFRLEGYRSGLREEEAIRGVWMVGGFESGFHLQTVVDLNRFGIGDCALELSVTAVIAEVSGAMSYWALCHAGPEADFHLRDSFVMAL